MLNQIKHQKTRKCNQAFCIITMSIQGDIYGRSNDQKTSTVRPLHSKVRSYSLSLRRNIANQYWTSHINCRLGNYRQYSDYSIRLSSPSVRSPPFSQFVVTINKNTLNESCTPLRSTAAVELSCRN